MEEALDVIARGEGEAEKWLALLLLRERHSPGCASSSPTSTSRTIDPRGVSTIPIGDRRHRPRARRARRPLRPVRAARGRRDGVAPARHRARRADRRARARADRQAGGRARRRSAPIPRPELPVYVLTGRFGPYVQLGEQEEGTKKKPKRASLFASQTPETVTLDEALQLLSLPRVVGTDAEGREIVASPGRFGPYLKRADGETAASRPRSSCSRSRSPRPRRCSRSRSSGAAASRSRRSPSSASTPTTGAPVRVLDGRYGPYVTDGTANATVPRGSDPGRAHARRGGRRCCARAPRPAPKQGAKKAAKKTAKKATKKAAKKTAKKAGEEGDREGGDEDGADRRPRDSDAARREQAAHLGWPARERRRRRSSRPPPTSDPIRRRRGGCSACRGSCRSSARSSCRASATGSGSSRSSRIATKRVELGHRSRPRDDRAHAARASCSRRSAACSSTAGTARS